MELQWPLILFTTLVAWSAGLFGAQAVLALKGSGRASQMPALVASVALLAAGGIAVFFHLEHWERVFNGFGHLTSGITQELIAIVVMVAIMVAYFVCLRKSDDGGGVPKSLAIVAIVASVALVAVMAHSYVMSARPAWDSIAWIAYVVGNACAFGAISLALIEAFQGGATKEAGNLAVAGTAINLAATLVYSFVLQAVAGSFADVGFYHDPTHPAKAMVDVASLVADQALLIWGGAFVVGAALPLACVLFARKMGSSWKVLSAVALACAFAGGIIMRVAFYNLGLSVFMFY